MNYLISLIVFSIIFIMGCRSENKKPTYREVKELQKELVDVNKVLVQKDREKIKAYVLRRGWDMVETDAGLWYQIYKEGSGEKAATGKDIALNYELYLLDGTICYASDSTGLKEFTIGKGSVETGLEIGVLYLQEGDQARLILPPHLAHGLVGDDACIPARSVVIYDLEVVKISN
ncbi:MAG: peptidylprolyl isomerase [Bacteroidetes bacterium]|jgi:FKBP-type peptidyl-prolyl cis-trans isomerase|nr:peptidylprolyl isomerase [Bacteroidota bacterium]